MKKETSMLTDDSIPNLDLLIRISWLLLDGLLGKLR